MTVYTWVGSGPFSQESNWSPSGGPPQSGDIAEIDSGLVTGSGSLEEVDTGGDVTLSDITLSLSGGPSSANGLFGLDVNGILAVTGGTINCTGEAVVIVGDQQKGSGTGQLTVSTGGQISCATFTLGFWAGNKGTATLDGAGVSVTTQESGGAFGYVNIGDYGTGILTVQNGAAFSAASVTVIGFNAQSNGSVTVSGQGSTLSFGTAATPGVQLVVGGFGMGTLMIQNGAQTTVKGDTQVGFGSGVNGSITVSGQNSSLTISGTATIGVSGMGTLTISNGGIVSAGNLAINNKNSMLQAGNVEIGSSSTSTTYSLLPTLFVGTDLTIANGASATVSSMVLGDQSGNNGSATITGSNSTLTVQDALTIGNAGTGAMTISGGATETFTNSVTLGAENTGNGTLTVTGSNSALTIQAALTVGNPDTGTGIFNVNSGATATIDANLDVNSGALTLNGNGTKLTVEGRVSLGVIPVFDGIATATISGGAAFNALSDLGVSGGGNQNPILEIDAGASLDVGGTLSAEFNTALISAFNILDLEAILNSPSILVNGGTLIVGNGLWGQNWTPIGGQIWKPIDTLGVATPRAVSSAAI